MKRKLKRIGNLLIRNKRKCDCLNMEVEQSIVTWIRKKWQKNVYLSDHIIQEKARRFQIEANSFIPLENQQHQRYSNGWLYFLKKRINFKCQKSYGESADAEIQSQRACLRRFGPDKVIADEFGLFLQKGTFDHHRTCSLEGQEKTRIA